MSTDYYFLQDLYKFSSFRQTWHQIVNFKQTINDLKQTIKDLKQTTNDLKQTMKDLKQTSRT